MSARSRLIALVTALVLAGAAVVAGGVALLLSNATKERSVADATIHSNAYLLQVTNVERLVVDVETGLRGYVITGHPLFLAPLRSAESVLPGTLTVLQQMAREQHEFVPQAQSLTTAVQTYLSTYVPAVMHLATTDLRRAQTVSATLTGKHLVDRIRSRADTLAVLVTARQTADQRATRRSADHSIAEAVVVLALLTLFTAIIGAVLGRLLLGRERARERSERTRKILQQSLLPRVPQVPGCEIAVRFTPAGVGDLVGGDFYDVFELEPRRWVIIVGDVAGKGAEAAAVTAMARWTLRSAMLSQLPPEQALQFLNDAMLREDIDQRFITIAYALLTVRQDYAEVSVACAGHPAPVLVPAAGDPEPLATHGDLLGAWPEIRVRSIDMRLSPGDSLVVYTDGVTDQGPQVSRAPAAVLGEHPPQASAESLAMLLERYAHDLGGPHRDDIAILALRYVGESGGAVVSVGGDPGGRWLSEPVEELSTT